MIDTLVKGWYVITSPKTNNMYEVYFDGIDMLWLNVEDPMNTDAPLKDCMMRISNWQEGTIIKRPSVKLIEAEL